MRVFVVWEPILSTDWSPPTTFALSRIPDVRVQQYWDPEHLIAKKLAADRRAPQPAEDCCEQDGILWDLVAVYPKDATWNDRLPVALLFNGPVVDVKADIEAQIVASPVLISRFGGPELYTERSPLRRSGETGRRAGLKIPFPSGSVGSIPTSGTNNH